MATSQTSLEALSKEELLKYIEGQSEQLSRYELRFRDVVKAYKSLTKEKEALEASLKALSRTKPASRQTSTQKRLQKENSRKEGQENESDTGRSETESDVPLEQTKHPATLLVGSPSQTDQTAHQPDLATLSVSLSSDSEEDEEDVETLRDQISTLTHSLAALTEQKAHMEANFQADKKKMMTEHEMAFQLMKKSSSEKESELVALREQLDEVMRVYKQEQMDRQLSEEGHGEVVRELQKMLSEDRGVRTEVEKELKELRKEATTKQRWIEEQISKGFEEKIEILEKELQETRLALEELKENQSKPHPRVVHLQEEIEQMKIHHKEALLTEQRRANDAEERLYIQAQNEEQRVSSLESRLSELSEIIGNYDRQKDEDQMSILKLKERVAQLDLENTSLTRAHIERQENRQVEEEMTALREQVAKLKALLRVAGQKLSDREALTFSLEDSSLTEYSAFISSQPSKKDYQDEISQLKEEFERYKLRAQNVLRSKGSKESDIQSSKDYQELKERNETLEKEIASLQKHYDEEMEQILKQNRELRDEMRAQHKQHQSEMSEVEASHKQTVQELQRGSQSIRERTLVLMKEKDEEIERLKREILENSRHTRPSYLPSRVLSRSSSSRLPNDVSTPNTAEKSSNSPSAVDELFEQSPSLGENLSLHHLEEQARRDIELANVKKAKMALEQVVRDLQEREAMLLDQSTFLKQEIRKLERDRTRETANMEYIKNIVLHYMCTNSTGREQMTSAIATALHFSEGELTKAREKYAKSWTSWR